jgi:hypothetical protein
MGEGKKRWLTLGDAILDAGFPVQKVDGTWVEPEDRGGSEEPQVTESVEDNDS